MCDNNDAANREQVFTVKANTITDGEVNENEVLILGQFKATDWGMALVKALRIIRAYDPCEYSTIDFRLEGKNYKSGKTESLVVCVFDYRKQTYADLESPDCGGWLFRFNLKYLDDPKAFEIVWDEEKSRLEGGQ